MCGGHVIVVQGSSEVLRDGPLAALGCDLGGKPRRPSYGNFTLDDAVKSLVTEQETVMDEDRIKGSAEQAKGKMKEGFGKATGDSKTEAEGKTDQAKGKI